MKCKETFGSQCIWSWILLLLVCDYKKNNLSLFLFTYFKLFLSFFFNPSFALLFLQSFVCSSSFSLFILFVFCPSSKFTLYLLLIEHKYCVEVFLVRRPTFIKIWPFKLYLGSWTYLFLNTKPTVARRQCLLFICFTLPHVSI